MGEYVNLNKCRSFNQTLPGGTAKTPLVDQICSEVIIVNRTGNGGITIFDNGYDAPENAFILSDGESATFRGITNTNQVSAVGDGNIYYRTQYFSNSPSR